MKKQVAVFFLYLLCFQYVLGMVAAVARNPRDIFCPNQQCGPRRPPRQIQCRITTQIEIKINGCFQRIQSNLDDYMDNFPTQTRNEVELSQGSGSGFANIRWTIVRCTCTRDFIRIFVRVEFLRILLSFVFNLLEDVLGGLLGDLGSALTGLLDNVVNLVIRILCLRIEVDVVILQRFFPGARCVLESFTVIRIATIQLLGLDLSGVARLLSPILTPIVNGLLRAILNERVRYVFEQEISMISIPRNQIPC